MPSCIGNCHLRLKLAVTAEGAEDRNDLATRHDAVRGSLRAIWTRQLSAGKIRRRDCQCRIIRIPATFIRHSPRYNRATNWGHDSYALAAHRDLTSRPINIIREVAHI